MCRLGGSVFKGDTMAKRGKQYKSPSGKFVSFQEYKAGKKLQKQAKQEKAEGFKLTKKGTGTRKPRGYPVNSAGKKLDDSSVNSAISGVKRQSKKVTEQILSTLDKGKFPSPDVIRTYKVPYEIKRYEWRFYGLIGNEITRTLLRTLAIRGELEDIRITTRVVIGATVDGGRYEVSTKTNHPSITRQEMDNLEAKQSTSTQLVFDNIEEAEDLYFDVIALMPQEIKFERPTGYNGSDRAKTSNKQMAKRKGNAKGSRKSAKSLSKIGKRVVAKSVSTKRTRKYRGKK
jgi:hypothetical protein